MAAVFGLYTHIQSNRRRSAALLSGLFLLVLLLVFAVDLILEGLQGVGTVDARIRTSAWHTLHAIPFAAIAVGAWLGIAWLWHQRLIDAVTGARAVRRAEAPELYNLLENLCVSRGMTMPTLRIVETEALNAFATGMNPDQYSIAVTRGLLGALDRNELESVLAHELTHIRNGDVRLMVVATVVAGIVALVAELVFRLLMRGPRLVPSGPRRGRRGLKGAGASIAAIAIGLAVLAVAWFLSVALRLALSRSREYLADAGAVELTGNPDAMISALLKISGRAEMPEVPSGIMEMCIENHKAGIADLFASHPPIEERIRMLVLHAGGRLPG